MRPQETISYEQKLSGLFQKMSAINDIEMQSHWAKYLCVLISGFLETAVKATLVEYVRNRADDRITNYVESNLGRFQNPKMGKILELVRAFDETQADQLQSQTEGKLKDHVDSIVANRHLIAHGRSSEVTMARVNEWFGSAKSVVTLLESICDL